MEMVDIAGRLHATQLLTNNNTTFTNSQIAAGTYILLFYDIEDNNALIGKQQIIVIK